MELVAARYGGDIPFYDLGGVMPPLTPTPDAAVAMDVRSTVKSRCEPEAWQHIAKAIYDPLRQRRRDALVAYIMHMNEDLDSVEKLWVRALARLRQTLEALP